MATSPTLFLDFDGVLHPDPFFINLKTREITLDPKLGTLFQWAPILAQVLDESPPVDIVLSTSWAARIGFKSAAAYLPQALASRVVDCVWRRDDWQTHRITSGRFHRLTRYQQISQYVQRMKVSRWIAIDDDDYGWPDELAHRLVLTHDDTGVSAAEVQTDLRSAIAILARPLTT
jgi:hypothetical protein